MKTSRLSLLFTVVALLALAASSCSDALLDEMARLASEANRPAISPANGTIVTAHETITLSFDEDMDPGSVSVSGSMLLDSTTLSWADARTLNVNPSNDVDWSAGDGKGLKVDITHKGQLSSYTYVFEVFNGVCVEGGDSNASDDTTKAWAGTQRHPFNSIAKAIGFIDDIYPAGAEVRVARSSVTPNEYLVNYSGDFSSRIVLQVGFSLKGGYSPIWDDRSTALYPTIIRDLGSGDYSFNDPNRAVDCGTGLTTATSIEGFHIIGSSLGTNSVALFCKDSSPTITDCIIYAGGNPASLGDYDKSAITVSGTPSGASHPHITNCIINFEGSGGTNTKWCAGISIYDYGKPRISCCQIFSGNTSTTAPDATSFGIRATFLAGSDQIVIDRNIIESGAGTTSEAISLESVPDTPIHINNNIIKSGPATTTTIGINSESCQVFIRNNTIITGHSTSFIPNNYGIYIHSSLSTSIDNNLFLNRSPSQRTTHAIYESYATTNAVTCLNNFFWEFDSTNLHYLYHDYPSTNIDEINTLNSLDNNEENFVMNPLIDEYFRPTEDSPSDFLSGGINGNFASWIFTDDLSGVIRPTLGGWTIGAYQSE